MRRLASVALSPADLSQDPYTERSVVRDTEFVFDAGSEVYELIAANGKVYVMQSYAQIVDDTLDEAALAQNSALRRPPRAPMQATALTFVRDEL